MLTFKTILVGLAIVLAFVFGVEIGYQRGHAQGLLDAEDRQIEFMVNYIIHRESTGRHEGVWGDKHLPYPAYGIAQFQKRTFNWMKKLAGRTDLSWKNEDDQRWLLAWALKNGYGSHWGDNYRRALRMAVESKATVFIQNTRT